MSKICPVSRPALQRASFPKERLLFFLKTCLCLVYLYIICDVRILLLLTYGMGRVSRNFTATEEASFEVDPGTTCTTCRLSTPVLLRVSHFKLLPGVVSWTLFDPPHPPRLHCWSSAGRLTSLTADMFQWRHCTKVHVQIVVLFV